MKEQSHKDEMANAIRGDFARLRSRGVATTLAPPGEAVEPAEEPPSSGTASAPDSTPVESPAGPERPWLARFLGSR